MPSGKDCCAWVGQIGKVSAGSHMLGWQCNGVTKLTGSCLPGCRLMVPWHWHYQQPQLLLHPEQANLHHHHGAPQGPAQHQPQKPVLLTILAWQHRVSC